MSKDGNKDFFTTGDIATKNIESFLNAIEELKASRKAWKNLCLQWKEDYKILRFSVDFYQKYNETMLLDNFTSDERDFYTWAEDMEWEFDNINDIEQAYRDYKDERSGLYE